MKAKVNRVTIRVMQGDILSADCAAIVVQTDRDLNLSPELLERAGIGLRRDTLDAGFREVGSAVRISGGQLKAQAILLAVSPRWGEGSERGKLASATFECLRIAEAERLKSVAFPALSAGQLGYPIENCATTMLTQVVDFTFEPLRNLRRVDFILEDALTVAAFERELASQVAALPASKTGGTG